MFFSVFFFKAGLLWRFIFFGPSVRFLNSFNRFLKKVLNAFFIFKNAYFLKQMQLFSFIKLFYSSYVNKKWTILRSPHVNNKSRLQYSLIKIKLNIILGLSVLFSSKLIYFFIEYFFFTKIIDLSLIFRLKKVSFIVL